MQTVVGFWFFYLVIVILKVLICSNLSLDSGDSSSSDGENLSDHNSSVVTTSREASNLNHTHTSNNNETSIAPIPSTSTGITGNSK